MWSAAFIALLLFAAWMLWPRSLAADLETEDVLSVVVTTMGMDIARDVDGALFSQPTNEVKTYRNIPVDSEAGTAIQNALDGFSYRLCLDSLTGKQDISNIGSLGVSLYGQDDWECRVFSGTGKCFLNGRIVKITGWGNENAEKLCHALVTSLQTPIPAASFDRQNRRLAFIDSDTV